ncbi:hypothetical protein H112_04580 [Trichophyton rubrum D6]|uniref:Regulator of volume decrease after cellular swelling-domain-containing protein n=3 Tax=Trichophyton TaxID=5550 RepID=A0A080WJB0_TRIRC|nr:uncharacterized protein TERG_04349 [Trichophyton rubrum CBS 118892]EZF22620.1 hypothetical protein H100_04587 [Trichophyton rubrum MR850]EZF41664.1 hypothetical protein H102_04574 [Trichophyton rubrum CBS 100081]EZF52334.1 hypothetical protein H103_04582 [Trichophyton rubrum CBS 288.86]EZF62834.1 hypothetical protein H104_04570 [Trichophyton rubrum CBS 289.86]EZF73542.1 hypothetical protein H105_04597 [Trichophyton soudanense CBS 452.61]EZF84247.1 hypothetical protein H110_04575 [Trichophy
MEVLHEAPNTSSFVPLAEHQSRTPASFYSGPPILHHFSERCKVVILERDLLASPALNSLRSTTVEGSSNGTAQGERGAPAGTTVDEAVEDTKELSLPGVSVWATSEKLLLFSTETSSGVAIPYPIISLHAIQRLPLPNSSDNDTVQGLYMQLATTSGGDENMDEDVDEDSISLTIIPLSVPATQPTDQETSTEEEDKKTQSQIEALFEAVSACSNLHPDPVEQDDEDRYEDADEGGLPPALPGSGGWITAENAHEYFDEDGNWKGGEEPPLGAGAGTVRPREDDDEGMNEADAANNANGTAGDETKWRRTE